MEGATGVINVFQRYNGDTWFFALFLAAVAYLLVRMDPENRRCAVLAIVSACLLVFNDLAFRVVGKLNGTETYYRFLWMIPVIPILSYVAVDLIVRQKKWYGRTLAVVIFAAAAVLAGDSYLSARGLEKPGDVHYVNGEAQAVCNLISADKQEMFPRVACDFSLVMSLRLLDPTINNAILREAYIQGENYPQDDGRSIRQRRLVMLVEGERMFVNKVKRALEYSSVSYLVIKTEYGQDALMQEAGCTIVGRTPTYTVYRTPY